MRLERTRNASRNIEWGALSKCINMLLQFVLRTVIIKKIGADYLGLNSLFTSILQILNLTELGFSNAILYSLYKPLAHDDLNLVGRFLYFYKKIYRVVGMVILIVGIMILPILDELIEGEYPDDINLYIVYIVYLFNTAISYFLFAYKKTLLTAIQRDDINNRANLLVSAFFYILQIVLIFACRNYYVYLSIVPMLTIFENIICGIWSKNQFPEYVCVKEPLDDELKKDILKRVSSIFILKLSQATRNSFDSIFISAYIGLTIVTIYNNYFYILSSVAAIMAILSNSIRAAIGNSVVTRDEKKNYEEMKNLNFCYMWLSGCVTICIVGLTQPFMSLWVGDELLLSDLCAILFAIYFYVLRIGEIRSLYIEALGLWKESQKRALLEMLANLILNWILVQKMGVVGILFATIVSVLFISQGYGTSILYKYYFKNEKFIDFVLENIKYFLAVVISFLIAIFMLGRIYVEDIYTLLMVRGVICFIIPNVVFYLGFRKDKRFIYMKGIISKMLQKT